jgi:type III secretory pathway component EscS
MPEKFKIKENGFDEVRKKVLYRTIPIVIIAAAGGLLISLFNSNGQTTEVNTLPFVIPIIIGALAFGLFKGLNRQKQIFNSFILTIDEIEVTREQALTPAISIPVSEIQQIIKNSKGTFVIKGKSPQEVIGIPSQIENSEALESFLSELKSITVSDDKSFVQKYQWVFPLLTVILMVITYLSTNKLLVGITGTTLTIGLIYSFITTQRSKHIDKKTKKSMWLVLIVLFAVIAITYFKLAT